MFALAERCLRGKVRKPRRLLREVALEAEVEVDVELEVIDVEAVVELPSTEGHGGSVQRMS